MRPCTCDRVTGPEYTPDQCRVCWLFHNDPAYRTHWARDRLSLPCIRLGPETGERHDSICCGGAKGVAVHRCAVHGTCTPRDKLSYRDATGAYVAVPWCVTCPDHEPAPDPFGGPVVRNLLFHVMPVSGTGVWQRVVSLLRKRIRLFNGRRVVAIVTGPARYNPGASATRPDGDRTGTRLDPPDHVRDAFGSAVHEFIEVPNNPDLREVATFQELFERVETRNPRHVIWYGHAKGVTRPHGHSAHLWTEMMLETSLDYWPLVEQLLRQYPICGPFLRTLKGWEESDSQYHFSGSMWWMRARDVFQLPDWRRIDHFWSGIESWCSLHFPRYQAGSIFHAFHKPGEGLYDGTYLRDVVAPDLERWRCQHAADRKEW